MLDYDKLIELGYSGHINNMLRQYFIDEAGLSDGVSFADAMYAYLVYLGATPSSIPDMWSWVFTDAGYTGSYNDNYNQFWDDLATSPPTAPAAFESGDWALADTGTSEDLSVTISSLPDNGGASITDVEYKVDAGSWTSSGGTGSFTIASLTNGTEYDVQLRAVNSVGNGTASDTKAATPTGVPDAFVIGNWTLTDPGTAGDLLVTISSLPDANGATITDVEYRLDSGSWVSSGGTVTFTISGLTDDVEYDVELQAVNATGDSGAGDLKAETPTELTFSVPNPSFTIGEKTQTGKNVLEYTASGGSAAIASIGTKTGDASNHFDVTFSAGTVSITVASAGDTADLSGGPYTITIPCYSGAAQTGELDNMVFSITVEADTFDLNEADGIDDIITLVQSSAFLRGDTLKLGSGTYNSAAADKRIKRSTAWNTTLTYPSYKTDARQGRDLTTGNLATITSRDTNDKAIIRTLNIDDTLSNSYGFRFTDLAFYRPNDGSESLNSYMLDYVAGGGHDCVVDDCTFTGGGFTFATDEELYSSIRLIGSNITIQDNTFNTVAHCFISPNISGNGDGVSFIGNTIANCWAEGAQVVGGDDFKYNWNTSYRKDDLDVTPELHSDLHQWAGPPTTATNVDYIGNRHIIGKINEGPGSGQGSFQDNAATAARIVNYYSFGNIHSLDQARSDSFQQLDDAYIRNNTYINDMENFRSASGIYVENKNGSAGNITGLKIFDNVTNAVAVSQSTGEDLQNNNTSLDHTNDATYTALFNSPVGGADLTIANLLSSLMPKASSAIDVDDHEPIIGAIAPSGRTAIIDYDARTTDFPWEEDGHTPSLTDLTGQSISTAVSVEEQVTGVSTTGAEIYITGGVSATYEIRESNNSTVVETGIGTGTANRRIIYANQYYEVSDTTSGSGSTQTNIVVHVGSETDTWSHTTTAVDVTAPLFASSTPTDNATGVAITVNPTITFTEAGTLSFGTSKNFTLYDVTNTTNEKVFSTATDVGSGPGKMSIAGNTVTLEPTSDLTNNVEYAIKWDVGAVKDDSANDVLVNTSNTLVSFTTVAVATNIITNGTFATDTNWTKGTPWSIGSGVAHCDGSAAFQQLEQLATCSASTGYTFSFDVSNITLGSGSTLSVKIVGGGAGFPSQHDTAYSIPATDDIITDTFTTDGATTSIYFTLQVNAVDDVFDIDNVVVVET